KTLPPEERYDLAIQIRRSSKAIAANIAEGYGRYHYLDSLRMYSIARGEINETLAHLINARILSYIEQQKFETIYALIRKAEMTLNGYMNYVRRCRTGHQEYGDRSIHEESSQYTFHEFSIDHQDEK
ncbi:MAG TPA: four helix bundle protein, partial [Anaerolineales bacterium]